MPAHGTSTALAAVVIHLRIFLVSCAAVFLASGLVLGKAQAQAQAHPVAKCAANLAACPVSGCEPEGSPHGLTNKFKRTIPPAGTAIRLTFDDFAHLQDQANEKVGQDNDLTQADRNKLRGLELSSPNQTVSEGDLVELTGFLIGLPHRPGPSGAESVNCRLTGEKNVDFHIPMGRHPTDSEFAGLVVEMIPQGRNPGWTPDKLKHIATEQRPVLVRGQLFYDNKHLVNDDPSEDKPGQPKRFTLWEIHPITEFLVCMTLNKICAPNSSQWQKLEQAHE